MTSGRDNWWQKQVEDLWLPSFVDLICRKLSDLADSQKQIITGMYPVPVGLAMQATVATVTGSVSPWFWHEFGREFYKNELIQLQSWLSLFGTCTLFSIDCICLFYEITNEIPWFRVFHGCRFKSAIPRIPRVFRDRGVSLALATRRHQNPLHSGSVGVTILVFFFGYTMCVSIPFQRSLSIRTRLMEESYHTSCICCLRKKLKACPLVAASVPSEYCSQNYEPCPLSMICSVVLITI